MGTVWILAGALAAGARAATLSDAAIEQRKSELSAAYRAAEDEAEAEFRDSMAFQTRLKDERLEFERRLLADREAMLDALKGLSPTQRQRVYDDFYVQEARRRQEFRARVAQLKASFRRRALDERAARRAVQSRP